MHTIKILFFATFRDLTGHREINFEIPKGADVATLKRLLGETYPKMAPASATTLVSINRNYAFDEDVIPEGAEIALFPPVSGG